MRLTPAGKSVPAHRSAVGVTWTQLGSPTSLAMGSSVQIGLASTASDNNHLNIAKFDNVSITKSITASPAVDQIRLVSNGTNTDYYLNGVFQHAFLSSVFSELLITPGGNGDTLTLDYSAGNPLTGTTKLGVDTDSIVVDYIGASSPIADIRAALIAGNIYSSTANSSGGAMTLGYGEASEILNISGPQTATFAGRSVDATAVLIKYVQPGDANLSGNIDADDYFAIDSNYNKSGVVQGYSKGDFNYDGVIDGDDYYLIDSNFGTGAPSVATVTANWLGAVIPPRDVFAASNGSWTDEFLRSL